MPPHSVLYVHPSNELYGGDRMLLWIVRLLDRAQFTPHVVVPNDLPYEGLLTGELDALGVTHHADRLGVLRRRYQSIPGMALFGWRTLASAMRLARYCRRHCVELVHSNSTAVLTGALAARLAGVPHVWHVREIITTPGWLNAVIARLLYHLSASVLTVSTPVREHLLAAEPRLAPKTHVVYDGLDAAPFGQPDGAAVAAQRASWGVPTDGIVLGMVGRISSWKGQDLLLTAAAPVLAAHPSAHLALVGGNVPGEEWREQALRYQIDALGLTPRVHLEGFRTDIPLVLASYDVFCLPSTRPDPFPGVVLEAMAAGLPVVATAHGGPTEQVVDGETGYLVSPEEPAALSAALERLLGDADHRRALGAAGRKRLLAIYTTERYVRAVEGVYQRLLSAAPVPRAEGR
ncbi:MAG: glycosyltransferase family 4 protein [Chloroflexi bacterium]|nr:glycosyltransferase family 4 protein [Chloroflexota bacterium]